MFLSKVDRMIIKILYLLMCCMLSLQATHSKKRARNDDMVMVDSVIQETNQSCLINRETLYLIEQFTRQQFVPTSQILPEKVYIYDEIIAVLLHKVNRLVEERASKRSTNDEDDYRLFSQLLNDLIRQNVHVGIIAAMLGSSYTVIDRSLIQASALAGNDMFAFVMGHECVRRSLGEQLYLQDLSTAQIKWLCTVHNKMLYGKDILASAFNRLRNDFILDPCAVFHTLGQERCAVLIDSGLVLGYLTQEQFIQSQLLYRIIDRGDEVVLKFVFSWLRKEAIFTVAAGNTSVCHYAKIILDSLLDKRNERQAIYDCLVNIHSTVMMARHKAGSPLLLLK